MNLSAQPNGAAPVKTRRPWTDEEREVVRQHYRTKGAAWCATKTGRTKDSVCRYAGILGVQQPMDLIRRPSTQFIDAAIRRAYENQATTTIASFAQGIGRTPQWVSQRAGELGLTSRRPDVRHYSEEEARFVEAHAHRSTTNIAVLMRKRGWKRTPASIKQFIAHRGFSRVDDRYSSTPAVALCFGVNSSTVTAWVRTGLLQAKREARATQNGLSYLIEDIAIARFVVRNPALVDMRKVDGVWLIDLLARLGAVASSDAREKQERILALSEARPDLTRWQIAEMTESSPNAVSVVISKAKAAQRARAAA